MPEPSTAGSDSIYAALLNAFAVICTALLTLLVGWLRDRRDDTRRINAIDEAFKRVQLLEAWYRTRTTVEPTKTEESRDIVLRELDVAMQAVKALEVPSTSLTVDIEPDKAMGKVGWFKKWFLLYKLSRPLAWPLRLFFHMSVAVTTLVFVDYCYTYYAGGWQSLRAYPFVLVLSILLATCLLARWFTIFVDRTNLFRRTQR